MKNREETSLNVAVIGIGKMGLLHSSLLNVLPHVKLVALCDKNRSLLRLGRKIFKGIELVEDLQLLKERDLDAIYLTTPIPSHFAIAKTIYTKKICSNLFIEKTLASNYKDGKELSRFAMNSGGVNMVGYMKRFSVTFRKAKSVIEGGKIGDVRSFNAYAYSSDFLESEQASKTSMQRGGVLCDLGSHIIDLGLWFFGDLGVGDATIASQNNGESEDSVHFDVSTTSKLKGNFDISWCKKGYRMPEFGIDIQGTDGSITVNDFQLTIKVSGQNPLTLFKHDLHDVVDFLLGDPEYFREDQHFVKMMLEKGKAEPDFDAASKVDLLIDQVKTKGVKIE